MNKKTENKPRWLFIDLDGTLIDSIPIVKKIFFRIGKYAGVQLNEEDFSFCDGLSLKEISEYISRKSSLAVSEIFLQYEKLLSNSYKKAKLRRGVYGVLRKFKQNGWYLAVVTSAKRDYAEAALKHHEIEKFFEFIISGESALRAKPHPDLFQAAQKKAGDGYFFALDDSENGIEAARGANCFVIKFDPKSKKYFFSVDSFISLYKKILTTEGGYPLMLSSVNKFSFVLDKNDRAIFEKSVVDKVDDFWLAETRRNPRLFDGKTFVITHEMKPGVFMVREIPYRYIHYQRQTAIFLGLIAIGVTGIIKKNEKVFLAKRSSSVTAYRDHYEYAPAGSVGADSLKEGKLLVADALKKECIEELNFSPKSISPSFLAFDGNDYVLDIVFDIEVEDNVVPKLGHEHSMGDFFPKQDLINMHNSGEKFIPLVLLCERI